MQAIVQGDLAGLGGGGRFADGILGNRTRVGRTEENIVRPNKRVTIHSEGVFGGVKKVHVYTMLGTAQCTGITLETKHRAVLTIRYADSIYK